MINNRVNGGYFWVRAKGGSELQPAYYDAEKDAYLLIGVDVYIETEAFDRFLRMKPPEEVVKGLEGEDVIK